MNYLDKLTWQLQSAAHKQEPGDRMGSDEILAKTGGPAMQSCLLPGKEWGSQVFSNYSGVLGSLCGLGCMKHTQFIFLFLV